jgi:hypothetical protein
MFLERGSLSLMSTIKELLERNSSCSGIENQEYVRGDPLRWPRDTLYPQKLALTSPTIGGRSVGKVRLRTMATEFVLLFVFLYDTYKYWSARKCRRKCRRKFRDEKVPSKQTIHNLVNKLRTGLLIDEKQTHMAECLLGQSQMTQEPDLNIVHVENQWNI